MYSSLEKEFRVMIQEIAPSPVYPKNCIINKVYTDGRVDITASFGEKAVIKGLKCIGEPVVNSDALLFDTGGGWVNGVVISDISNLISRIEDLETRIKKLEEKK